MSTEGSESMAPWIAERAAAREAAWAARRAERDRFRAERKTARDAGLELRYAEKTARGQRRSSIA